MATYRMKINGNDVKLNLGEKDLGGAMNFVMNSSRANPREPRTLEEHSDGELTLEIEYIAGKRKETTLHIN